MSLAVRVLPGGLAVARLPAAAEGEAPGWPAWALSGAVLSVTRTADEISIVCAERCVPEGVARQRGFRALVVRGPLPFALVGVLAQLAVPLAAAGVPIFVLSTHDTDYLLVPGERLDEAVAALEGAGISIDRAEG